ncbi:hypothetical protein WDU94_006311, partial [Cyamophila willieti]
MDDNFTTIKEIKFNFSCDEFINAINIWISKPHTVNKRVLSIVPILHFNIEHLTAQQVCHIKELSLLEDEQFKVALESYVKSLPHGNVSVQVRKLISRSESHFKGCVEMVLEDYEHNSFLFHNLSSRTSKSVTCSFPFMIQFDQHHHNLYLKVKYQDTTEESPESLVQNANQSTTNEVLSDTKTTDPLVSSHQTETFVWLQQTLLPKLIKWAENASKCNSNPLVQNSLQLINMSEYSTLYNTLKMKYGKEITE